MEPDEDAIDWKSVAARIAVLVDGCCGCSYYEKLTVEEALTLDAAKEPYEENENGT
jgi:hypothetical protein